MRFTAAEIRRLPLAADKGKADLIYFDDDLPGFGLRIRSGGKRSWIIQYRNSAGNTRRQTLGDVRTLDLEKARRAAKARLATVTLGGDPQAEKLEARNRAKITLGSIADRYLEFKKLTLRPSTYKADQRYLTHHWKPLRGVPLHAIKRMDVAARLGELVKAHGSTAAARARSTLSALFTWAMREGVADENPVIGTNDPAAGIPSRDRVLGRDEIRVIWNNCRDDDFGRIVRLLLLTGCRREEIGGLEWAEVNFDSGVMTIPGRRTKNHRTLSLTLPAVALDILQSAPRREDRKFVFGERGGAFSAWSYSTLALSSRVVVT